MRPRPSSSLRSVRAPLMAALAATLLLPLVAAGPVVGPAAAAICPASGGVAIPRATASGDVVFQGGGWGHGLGMSQYGAEGAARLGCSAQDILTRYYTGTAVVPRPMPSSVLLRLLDNGYRVDIDAVAGALTWTVPGCLPEPPTTPAPTTPAPTTPPPPCPPVQPQGARWQLRLDDATHNAFVLYDLGVSPKLALWTGGSAAAPLRLQEGGSVAHLTTWQGSSIYLERSTRWDWTALTIDGGLIDAVQQIDSTPEGPAMEKYLWGLAEVPSSFPAAALQAQAIAARTYAAKRAGRILMPTPADQNWTGWAKESEGPGGAWGAAWRAAVDATAGQVIAATTTGTMIDAFYSSSTGGYSEDERYVWGVEAPFLRPVDDSAWDAASSNPAGKRSWAVGFTWSTLARRLGFASISSISVPPRGSAERVTGVRITGLRAGRLLTTYVDGWDVKEALGLSSPGFTTAVRHTGGPSAQPLVGDWDGDGRQEPGWFRDGQVALSMTGPSGPWTKRFAYGRPGDIAVVGDWDHDGRSDLGVFRAGTWLLRAGLTGGAPTTTVRFGRAGDRPVIGSWTGTSLGLGVVRSAGPSRSRGLTWLLRRTLSGGHAQRSFRFGRTGDVPVVGSWDGAARTGVGVARGTTWVLRGLGTGHALGPRVALSYGLPAGRSPGRDRHVVGDWDGDHDSTPTVVRGRSFVARVSIRPDPASGATTTSTFLG